MVSCGIFTVDNIERGGKRGFCSSHLFSGEFYIVCCRGFAMTQLIGQC